MNYFITLVFVFITVNSLAQPISYADWKKEAKTQINLQPKYGNATKTKDQQALDQQFIKSTLANNGTARKASDQLVQLGFDYLYRQDLKTAMRRFNQAWLLDASNEDAFWGFGAVYFTLGDPQTALVQYEEGLRINPKSTNILTDKATVFMAKYSSSRNEVDYKTALTLFRRSYTIDPKNQNTLFKLSACYFVKQDCANAWKYYDECTALGGKPITRAYTEALTKSCSR